MILCSTILDIEPYIEIGIDNKSFVLFQTQHGQNGGKCGECGDAYHLKRPREQEGGGKYGRGIIAGRYSAGDVSYSQLVKQRL
jgi:hypothetical protein